VKAEYREFATGSTDSQYVKVDIDDRFGYLGNRLAALATSTGPCVVRVSQPARLYDIFGSVIGVQESAAEPAFLRQWQDAVEHVVKPRFLFPARRRCPIPRSMYGWREVTPLRRCGSAHRSALAIGGKLCRFRLSRHVGRHFRPGLMYDSSSLFHGHEAALDPAEGLALGFVYSVAQNGMEMSLPKMLEPP